MTPIVFEFNIRIGRERPHPEPPEPPAVYDTAPAHIELGIHDYEPDNQQRIGFNAKENP